MIRFEGLCVTCGGRQILRDLTFDCPEGVTVLVGANGCGKSTALKALMGLVPLTSGGVTVDGQPLKSLAPRARAAQVAYLSQEGTFLADEFTVFEMALMSQYHKGGFGGRYGDEDAERTRRWLQVFDLEAKRDQRMGTLSGGERQRVALARSFAQGAKWIVLDEPTNHLDAHHATALVKLLKSSGLNALVVLHDLNYALALADHLVVMEEGAAVAQGAPEEVLTPAQVEHTWRGALTLYQRDGKSWVLPSL